MNNSDSTNKENQKSESEQAPSSPLRSDDEWKKILPPRTFRIARLGDTEPPFSGEYYDLHADGTYRCVCCKTVLFSSQSKYDSGSGWPSFYAAVDDGRIEKLVDTSHGMIRTEIRCANCKAHLGHLFPDGPRPTGLRFCVNSASLSFEPKS